MLKGYHVTFENSLTLSAAHWENKNDNQLRQRKWRYKEWVSSWYYMMRLFWEYPGDARGHTRLQQRNILDDRWCCRQLDLIDGVDRNVQCDLTVYIGRGTFTGDVPSLTTFVANFAHSV